MLPRRHLLPQGSVLPDFALLPPSLCLLRASFTSLYLCCRTSRTCLARSQRMQQTFNRTADDVIDQPEVAREDKDRDDHHNRGGLHFRPSGPPDLAHLAAHFLQELPQALGLVLQLLHSRVCLFRYCYRLGHSAASIFMLLNSGTASGLWAGQTGGGARIRTEKFCFGDRQFNR